MEVTLIHATVSEGYITVNGGGQPIDDARTNLFFDNIWVDDPTTIDSGIDFVNFDLVTNHLNIGDFGCVGFVGIVIS